jgi:hypothetical protein
VSKRLYSVCTVRQETWWPGLTRAGRTPQSHQNCTCLPATWTWRWRYAGCRRIGDDAQRRTVPSARGRPPLFNPPGSRVADPALFYPPGRPPSVGGSVTLHRNRTVQAVVLAIREGGRTRREEAAWAGGSLACGRPASCHPRSLVFRVRRSVSDDYHDLPSAYCFGVPEAYFHRQ